MRSLPSRSSNLGRATTPNATTTARVLEDCGVQAIAVHGRTKEQGYSGIANWDVIEQVAAAVQVPVIGNGDIAEPEDAVRAMTPSESASTLISALPTCPAPITTIIAGGRMGLLVLRR